jgi:hypothetical protein
LGCHEFVLLEIYAVFPVKKGIIGMFPEVAAGSVCYFASRMWLTIGELIFRTSQEWFCGGTKIERYTRGNDHVGSRKLWIAITGV